MKISPINNNKQVNFGSVNLVQVSKSAFKNLENLSAVDDVFSKYVNAASGENGGILSKLFLKLGIRKKATKSLFFLETPSFSMIDGFCKKNHIPNQFWLAKRFGIGIIEPKDRNFHSFYVLTGEDKNKLWDMAFGSENSKFSDKVNEIVSKRREFAYSDKKYLDCTDGKDFFEIEQRIVADSLVMPTIPPPENIFRINKLSELPDVLKQIDYQ